MVAELEPLRAGRKSIGAYGESRNKFHKGSFGKSQFAEELLHLEEHAFCITVYKFAATSCMTAPESFSARSKEANCGCPRFRSTNFEEAGEGDL